MKKNMMLLAFGAAMIAGPALAMPAGANAEAKEWTRAEAQTQAVERFAKMDVNRDGKWDSADRAAQRSQRQDARFAALDANKDGSVSKAEWDQHGADRLAKSQARSHERRSQHAANRGAEGAADGARAATEGKRTEMRGHSGRRGGGHHGMGRGGARETQSLTQAEFVARSLARFDRMDANKDGKVTHEERTAARVAMREHRGEHRVAPVKLLPATK